MAAVAASSDFPDECIFVAVYGGGEEFAIPRGNRIINVGDEIYLIADAEDVKKAADFLSEKTV